MTAKQVLVEHIEAEHSTKSLRRPAASYTYAELGRWHADRHYRYGNPNHYHEGVNLGPANRPSGWKTGEGAIKVATR